MMPLLAFISAPDVECYFWQVIFFNYSANIFNKKKKKVLKIVQTASTKCVIQIVGKNTKIVHNTNIFVCFFQVQPKRRRNMQLQPI